MKFLEYHLKIFIYLLAVPLLLSSCADVNPDAIGTSPEQDIQIDTTLQIETDSSIVENSSKDKTISCLEIKFIESVESGWNESYQQGRLTKRGFTRVTSKGLANGNEIVFEKKGSRTKLTLSKSTFPDGESVFSAKHVVQENEFDCFTRSLTDSKYQKNSDGSYKKRGLGSYEEKTITLLVNNFSINYVHRVGKELSAAPIFELNEFAPIIYQPEDSVR
jgi:hypothetical protein